MRPNATATVLVITALWLCRARADDFSSLWYDGNAEISTYRLIEARYGEQRNGVRIMVFVTEPMRLSSHIKPDDSPPDSEIVPVIKLNDIRRFATGIYDYSVMTSVYSAVEARSGTPLFGTMKTAFTAQEWCGTVAERTLRGPSSFEGVLYSYFESEGEAKWSIPHQGTLEAEEDLWIVVRELRGEALSEGEARSVRIVPSAWGRRKRHEAAVPVPATLSKGTPERRATALGKIRTTPFAWTVGADRTLVWVENAYPHRIVGWEEPDGSWGELIASRRQPYWKQHDNEHLYLRGELGLAATCTTNVVEAD